MFNKKNKIQHIHRPEYSDVNKRLKTRWSYYPSLLLSAVVFVHMDLLATTKFIVELDRHSKECKQSLPLKQGLQEAAKLIIRTSFFPLTVTPICAIGDANLMFISLSTALACLLICLLMIIVCFFLPLVIASEC